MGGCFESLPDVFFFFFFGKPLDKLGFGTVVLTGVTDGFRAEFCDISIIILFINMLHGGRRGMD